MTCDQCREVISARLDGEITDVDVHLAGRHLRTCASCRRFEAQAAILHREIRIREAEGVPDLTSAILLAFAESDTPPAGRRDTRDSRVAMDVRLALASIALVHLALALPALLAGAAVFLGNGVVSAHVARHLGALEVALAVGFLAAAWRPRRAEGVLPVVGALALGLFLASGIDLTTGGAVAFGEVRHVLEIGGLVCTWLVSRQCRRTMPAALA